MFGKTITALAIAYKMQLKMLVVCTTTNIRDQWIKEVKKHFGFEPGIIGSGHYNINPPIVIGNIQTVSKRSLELRNTFGIIVVDEAHHCPASTFSKVLDESLARYRIGLTGTLKRKDGLEATFSGHFGEKIFIPAVNNTIPPVIHGYKLDAIIPGNIATPWALRINELYESQEFRSFYVDVARVYRDHGYKVLITTDRTELANYLYAEIEDSYMIVGGTENREEIMDKIAKSPKGEVLVASISIFSEGVSLDELSALLNTTSTDNESLVEQLAGRIMRKAPGKRDPVIIDVGLDGVTGTRHRSTRYNLYYSLGWQVRPVTKDNISTLLKK